MHCVRVFRVRILRWDKVGGERVHGHPTKRGAREGLYFRDCRSSNRSVLQYVTTTAQVAGSGVTVHIGYPPDMDTPGFANEAATMVTTCRWLPSALSSAFTAA